MIWSYGVTTVPQRFTKLLPNTLSYLSKGGFDAPHLFIDGDVGISEIPIGFSFTLRNPKVHTAGNWALSLAELYVRNPHADRYAIFQDDIICCKNLKQYLESWEMPAKGYLNLMTFLDNEGVIWKKTQGWHEAVLVNDPKERAKRMQAGRSAMGLVFDREGVINLLSQRPLVERFQNKDRGHKRIDGGIVKVMNDIGYREYVHNPSLLQHAGVVSTTHEHGTHMKKWTAFARTFPGSDFDAITLIQDGLKYAG